MANTSSSTGPRGGAGTTPRVPVPTRRGAPATGADAIAGERIMPGTPLSTSPTSQASSDWADAQGADADELELDDGQTGGSTGDGQPKKKKTRRAGAAITRVRRMQREVRRLAEEEDQTGVQRQQPQRSLLPTVQSRPHPGPSRSPPLLSPPPLSIHTALPYSSAPSPSPGQQMRAVTSPARLPATRPSSEGMRLAAARSDTAPAAHSRAYDRTLEEGDDVVVWRPAGAMSPIGGSSNIWAYRPDERPRGGST